MKKIRIFPTISVTQDGKIDVYFGGKKIKFEYLTREFQRAILKDKKEMMKDFKVGPRKDPIIVKEPYFKKKYQKLYENQYITEITKQEVAKKFGIDTDRLQIRN